MASGAAQTRQRPMRKSERRRAEILQRAAECFDRKGYANTSLDDIAKAVGIRREGIYYYFKNRAQILLNIIEPQSIALIDGLSAILADDARGPREKFAAAIRNHLERFDRYCLEMTVSLRDGRFGEEPDVRDTMNRIWKSYERMWTGLIADGQASGAFRPIGDPKMLALGVLGMCNWLARWYNPREPVAIDALIASYTELLAGGLFEA
jgi:AcrR family transcriptional regulator